MNRHHPKRHHTVPQFLLKNFAFGKKKNRIWVFDKWEDKAFETTIKNVSVVSRFYDAELADGTLITLENSLSELEGKAATILKRVLEARSIRNLDLVERITVADFVAAQQLRTRHLREFLREMDDIIEEAMFADGVDPTTVKLCVPGLDVDDAPYYKRQTEEEVALSSLRMLSDFVKEHEPILSMMNWSFVHAPGESLYISDDPICLHNERDADLQGNLGLLSRGIEIYLPLASDSCIRMCCPKEYPSISDFVEIDNEQVRRLNCLQTCYSTRYLYARSEDFTLARDYLRENPTSRKPPRSSLG